MAKGKTEQGLGERAGSQAARSRQSPEWKKLNARGVFLPTPRFHDWISWSKVVYDTSQTCTKGPI
jgi:hypothetical protein